MYKCGSKLQKILEVEIAAGNTIEGSYEHAFARCALLIVLRRPFQVVRDNTILVKGLEAFSNSDSHYPVGHGYIDCSTQTIVMAPG